MKLLDHFEHASLSSIEREKFFLNHGNEAETNEGIPSIDQSHSQNNNNLENCFRNDEEDNGYGAFVDLAAKMADSGQNCVNNGWYRSILSHQMQAILQFSIKSNLSIVVAYRS